MSKKDRHLYQRYYDPKNPHTWSDAVPNIVTKKPSRRFSDVIQLLIRQKYIAQSDPGYMTLLPKGVFLQKAILARAERIMQCEGALQYRFPGVFSSREIRTREGLFEKFKHQIIDAFHGDVDERLHLKYASDPLLLQYLSGKAIEVPAKIYSPDYFFRRAMSGEVKPLINPREFYMLDFHMFYERDDFSAYAHTAILNKNILETIVDPDTWYWNIDTNEQFFLDNERRIIELLDHAQVPAVVNVTNERTHYYDMQNQYVADYFFGNKTQLANLQFDTVNGSLFEIVSKDSGRPVSIVHGTVFGRVEKIIAYVFGKEIEKFEKTKEKPILPIWLTPIVVRVIVQTQDVPDIVAGLTKELEHAECRFDIDERSVSLSAKIKDAEQEWIPYVVVIGDTEMDRHEISVRDRLNGTVQNMPLDTFLEVVEKSLVEDERVRQTTPRIYTGEYIY